MASRQALRVSGGQDAPVAAAAADGDGDDDNDDGGDNGDDDSEEGGGGIELDGGISNAYSLCRVLLFYLFYSILFSYMPS